MLQCNTVIDRPILSINYYYIAPFVHFTGNYFPSHSLCESLFSPPIVSGRHDTLKFIILHTYNYYSANRTTSGSVRRTESLENVQVNTMKNVLLKLSLLFLATASVVTAQGSLGGGDGYIDDGPQPDDLNGSNFTYPYQVKVYNFPSQRLSMQMAFMDVAPANTANTSADAPVAVLLHGKNFCGATWNETIIQLTGAGYRVIAPDQVGWCKSTKPVGYQFTFQQLALNTNSLLKQLGIYNATIIGHSTGGMLAARYAL